MQGFSRKSVCIDVAVTARQFKRNDLRMNATVIECVTREVKMIAENGYISQHKADCKEIRKAVSFELNRLLL